ncbi:unnamed protein product [Trichogramma brassicae]|uniref:Uncharacterized protein n=1 Tax=Trichogramma brassicae TaxID=86971 RepID=A0A6H5J5Z0_9HYME|nr:unnamed protein product [Trichogramma brassicae]
MTTTRISRHVVKITRNDDDDNYDEDYASPDTTEKKGHAWVKDYAKRPTTSTIYTLVELWKIREPRPQHVYVYEARYIAHHRVHLMYTRCSSSSATQLSRALVIKFSHPPPPPPDLYKEKNNCITRTHACTCTCSRAREKVEERKEQQKRQLSRERSARVPTSRVAQATLQDGQACTCIYTSYSKRRGPLGEELLLPREE